jgi:uroporphyrinogen-III synthase
MTVLLIRANRNNVDRDALAALGIDSLTDPYLTIRSVDNPQGAIRLLNLLASTEPVWLVITSANALTYWYQQCPGGELENLLGKNPAISYAAIGEQTASVLRAFGVRDILVPPVNDSRSLADIMAEGPGCPVVIPSGNISMKSIPERLVPEGFEVIEEVFYATEPVTEVPRSLALIQRGVITSVVLRSPSAARAFFSFVGELPRGFTVICGGNTTAREARRLGADRAIVASDPSPQAIARTVLEHSQIGHR